MFASFILVPYMRTCKVVYRINRFQITIYFAVCEKVNPFKVEQTLKTQFVPLIGFFSVILCYKYTSYRLHPFGWFRSNIYHGKMATVAMWDIEISPKFVLSKSFTLIEMLLLLSRIHVLTYSIYCRVSPPW